MTHAQILIVEDERLVALDIQTTLESLGYKVGAIASSGETALQLAREIRPDLVLMDIRLQGLMNGIDAADRIRSELGIPVIYLTAYADEVTVERAKYTGPFGYLLKPFGERELHIAIEIALHKHAMEQTLKEREQHFRLVSQISSDYSYSVSVLPDGRHPIEWIGGDFQRITGYTQEEVRDLSNWLSFIQPEDLPAVQEAAQAALSNKPSVLKYRIRTKAGQERWLCEYTYPIWDEEQDRVVRIIGAVKDITDEVQSRTDREQLITQLEKSLATVRVLKGMLPICASCKKIRDEQGRWHAIEVYIRDHSEADFSHGLCPDCFKRLYPDFYKADR
jgi:PAS domain S-box-containing protein